MGGGGGGGASSKDLNSAGALLDGFELRNHQTEKGDILHVQPFQ